MQFVPTTRSQSAPVGVGAAGDGFLNLKAATAGPFSGEKALEHGGVDITGAESVDPDPFGAVVTGHGAGQGAGQGVPRAFGGAMGGQAGV